MARAGGGARDELHGYAPEDAPPPGDGFCGTLWDICPCLLLMSLCRRWWTSCRTLSISSPHSRSPDPEQVIEVPKILHLDVPMRAALRVAQLVEQLVEVPTTVSYSSLQRTLEQLVDIPVPGGGGPSSVFMGFSQDSVQQRRLPENAFLSGLWSRSLTLFLVEVFLVLSQVKFIFFSLSSWC